MSSALRVKAKVFQWVKKALSMVRKNNLEKWKFENMKMKKEKQSKKVKPPGTEEKIEVSPCKSLGKEKVDCLY